jgi:hypothetical protein
VTYIMLWLGVQTIRASGFDYLTDDAAGAAMIWGFVLIDKYTGPLGNAAVETALLTTLQDDTDDTPPPQKPRRSRSPSRSPSRSRSRGRSPAASQAAAAAVGWTVP